MGISYQFEYDLFISHASEDKDSFVNPLADRLSKMGLRVWYDTHSLDIGDSLRRSIDKGLSSSKFGLVILSHAFFKKEWPQKELDALISLESDGVFRIIPVWHDLSKKELSLYSPLLADRVGIQSSIGIESLALILHAKISKEQSKEIIDKYVNLEPQIKRALLETPHIPSIDLLEEGHPITKTKIHDRRTYVQEVSKLLFNANDISILGMDGVLPYVFYGATKKSFEELREAECKQRVTMMGLTPEVYFYWNSFWDSYRSGKFFRYAITVGSVDLFQRILFHQFNPIRSLEIIDRIKSDLMLLNLDIRLVNHSSSFCTFISSNCLLFALISPRVSGIVSSDKDIILVYQLMFDNYFSNGSSFQKFLKDCEIVLKKKINSK